tara:strand:- start:224 stop:418 length:195 start_codon:yes stop_codon:yes gene_type:complete
MHMLFIDPPEYLRPSDFFNTSKELIKNTSDKQDFISSVLNSNNDQKREFYALDIDDFQLLVGYN